MDKSPDNDPGFNPKKAAKTKTAKSEPVSKAVAIPETVAKKPEKAVKKALSKAVETVPEVKSVPVLESVSEVEQSVSEVAKSAIDTAQPVQPTAEERYRMVQTAAYFIAERDGFAGKSTDYWIAAELQIGSVNAL